MRVSRSFYPMLMRILNHHTAFLLQAGQKGRRGSGGKRAEREQEEKKARRPSNGRGGRTRGFG